jgi:nucleotide-binding universal stress UspA family protein
MPKRILVPLDTTTPDSPFLATLAALARGAGATVRLLHVAPHTSDVVDAEGRTIAYADQETERLLAEARDALQAVELALDGLPVETVVGFGDPVREILLEAEAFDADLVAIHTSARSSLARAVLGSVAEQVFRRAPLPVALFRD